MIPKFGETTLMDKLFGFYWKDKLAARANYARRGHLLLALNPWHERNCNCYSCYL